MNLSKWFRFVPIALGRKQSQTPREQLGMVLPLWPAYRVTHAAKPKPETANVSDIDDWKATHERRRACR